MPAEWEPHEATWISWPHKQASWPGAFDQVPDVFVQIVSVIAECELVRINVASEAMADDVRTRLGRAGVPLQQVRFHLHPTNDAWVRDHGPVYIVNDDAGLRAITDWEYNSWGGKYPPCDLDNAIPERIARESAETCFPSGLVLEGGSIDVDGHGTLLTTEACLLNPNRNPRSDRGEIEQALRNFLGVQTILWLGDGIVGDDTDGHIDDLTRFVGPGRVVTVLEEDPLDANFAALRENVQRLQSMSDNRGRPLEVISLPMPGPVYFGEERLPASYANFYIANRRVLVPVYGHANDQIALDTLQRLFPERLVVGVDCTPLVWGLGAIHCVTQQQPSVPQRPGA
jgi:agmatine deiminase